MATVTLGNIKFNWKGAWNSSTAYVVDDVVSLSGSSYVCIQAGTNQNPSTATAYWEQMSAAGANGTNGTDLTTTLTTQGDIVYRDGSGLARLAAGTSGQVLQTGGSGANPSWGTISSDCVKLANGTFNTSASQLDIDGYFNDSTYAYYKFIFSTQSTGASGNTIRFRWRNSSGSALSDGAYYYTADIAYGNSGGSSVSATRGWGHDHVAISHFGNDNNERTTGEITMANATDSNSRPTGIYHSFAKDGSSQFATWKGGFMYTNAATVNGFRLYSDHGNFTQTGHWALYGFKK